MTGGVKIEVQSRSSPDWVLDFTLTNRSQGPLKTYRHSLPWVGRNSTLLIAAEVDAVGTILERSAPIDDPSPETITIDPSESIKGSIQLLDRFQNFLEVLKKHDVAVFWSYQFRAVEGNALERVGGFVLFSRINP